jgi:molybdenum cofactor cytidylyltransferase
MRIANRVIGQQGIGQYDSAVVASLDQKHVWAVVGITAGVILAGGGSSRLGQAKMLLPWRGKPLVRHAAEAGLAGGLDPLIVVLGAENESIRQALAGLPVRFVYNPDWQHGQSTSVRHGIRALDEGVGAAVFQLADQPLVSADVIHALVQKHQKTLAAIIAPKVGARRANPVLFDRETFDDLQNLSGDSGGRAIFDRYPVSYIDWADENLLFDVDTPDDYLRLQNME